MAAIATTSATTTSVVGGYVLTASGGMDSNYDFSYTPGTLTIGKALLTVTADDKSKEYGEVNPTLTVSYSGFKGSDDVNVLDMAAIATTSATTTSVVGGYPIVVEGASDHNYNMAYEEGLLTIIDTTPPPVPIITHISDFTCSGNISVTGDNTLKLYGVAERSAIVNIFLDGLLIGTTTQGLSGYFMFDYTATVIDDGTYSFTVSATDASGNTSSDSEPFTITINTLDTDGDGIFDFCEDDVNGDGILDADQDCDGDGIIDNEDTDLSSCTKPIIETLTYGFSPNGDGINDSWVIKNITAFPNNMVSVYNRSGKLVFKQIKYQNNWQAVSSQTNGNIFGKRLPAGVYLFIIDLGDGSAPIRGWLYINY